MIHNMYRSKEFHPAYGHLLEIRHYFHLEYPTLCAQHRLPGVYGRKSCPVRIWEDVSL